MIYQATKNTDRELYREPHATGAGDSYSDSIHVTEGGGIGISCGGHVIVMSLRNWHRAATGMLKALESPYVGESSQSANKGAS